MPTPTSTQAAGPTGLVVYEWEGGIWVVNTDGTDAHELLPDEPATQEPLAWSADGSRLLYRSSRGLAMTDAAGSEPEEYELQCPVDAASDPLLYACQVDTQTVAFSPDGKQLAYAIWEGSRDQANKDVTSTLVVLDLATRLVKKLESTQTASVACESDSYLGDNHSPSWSPDGTRLLFAGPTANRPCEEAILSVNVDSGDLQQIVPPSQDGASLRPSWSPDGPNVAFNVDGDIYAVRADGTGLRPLTSDGHHGSEYWTRDGRIVSIRWSATVDDRGDLWIMDADGGNGTQIDPTIPALTAAGCLVCPYPIYAVEDGAVVDPLVVRQTPPFERFWITTIFPQPAKDDQP